MQPICTRTISLQSSKPSHVYPIIQLPRKFRSVAGAKGTVLQTIYKGALAFLVVISDRPLKGVDKGSVLRGYRNTSLHAAEVGRSNRPEPIVFPAFFNEISSQTVPSASNKKLSTLPGKLSTTTKISEFMPSKRLIIPVVMIDYVKPNAPIRYARGISR